MLLPDGSLQRYYTDKFSLDSKSQAERKLTEFALINMDEMNMLPDKKMPLLKNLMQTVKLNIIKSYQRDFSDLAFYKTPTGEAMIGRHFRVPRMDEDFLHLSAAEVLEVLRR